MRIRTLDQDLDSNQLEIVKGGNGDVYVTIYPNEVDKGRDQYRGWPIAVRVGMTGSGHGVPAEIKTLFMRLAEAFEKYKDCKWESDAQRKEMEERINSEL